MAATGRQVAPSPRWNRWLERLLLVFPVVVGAGVVAVIAEAPVPQIRRAVLTGVAAAALAIRLGIPAFLWLDARAIDRSEVPWEPNRYIYASAALLVSAPLVALVYLYRRYEYLVPSVADSHWWVAVAVSGAITPLTVAVGLYGTVVAVSTVLAFATTIAAGLLPVGIYRDAAYVRASEYRWNPNPALYLGVAFVCLAVAILQPLLAVWYLGKRYRAGVEFPVAQASP